MLGAAGFAFGAAPAHAGTEFPMEYKCPVGGEKFTQKRRLAWTEYGKRPDGKVYSNWVSPAPLIECPGNKLLMQGEYSEADVAKLKDLIATPEYLKLRKEESPYYALAWLYRKLGREPKWVMGMIQRAGWESDDKPERRRRYMREMVAEAKQALAAEAPDSMAWWQVQWMIVNALRETGSYDEAIAAIASLPLDKLNIAVPDKKLGDPPVIEEEVSPVPGFPKVKRQRENVINTKEISDAKTRVFLFNGFTAQKALIAERNSGSEPVQLIPEQEKLRRCKWFGSSLTASETAVCTAPEWDAKVKAYRGTKESNYN
jgi:hypothetical protein